MRYEIQFKPEAEADLARLSPDVTRRIIKKLDALRNDLAGDVKRLVHYTPGWRLRVGDWRVLFEVIGNRIVIWRVVHRSKAYE
jgi:mRNA interferase RelE/StbE